MAITRTKKVLATGAALLGARSEPPASPRRRSSSGSSQPSAPSRRTRRNRARRRPTTADANDTTEHEGGRSDTSEADGQGSSSREIQHGFSGSSVASPRRADPRRRHPHVPPGDRHRDPAGDHRAVPGLEPRALRAGARVARLALARRRTVGRRVLLPRVPRRPARRHRDRVADLLPPRLGRGDRRVLHVDPEAAASRLPPSGWRGCWCSAPSRWGSSGWSSSTACARSSPTDRRGDLPHHRTGSSCWPGNGSDATPRPARLVQEHAHHTDPGHDVGRDLDTLELREGVFVGSAQILALFAGISRSGVTMVAGLLRGLDHEDAARLSFMLATPVILAAGVYKLPDLLGHNGDACPRSGPRRQHRGRVSRRTSRCDSSRSTSRPARWFRSRSTASCSAS